MSGDRILTFVVMAVGSVVAALLAIVIFDHLLSTPAALEPGDPLYPQQQGIVETFATILPWLVIGVAGAAMLVIGMLRDGF